MDKEQNKIIEGSSRTPGFRFYPTEEELLGFYLHNKLHNLREEAIDRVIPVVHVHHFDPWQLPQISGESSVRESEQWFFFCARQEREAHGGRPARTTPSGYWKATGTPGLVYSSSNRPMGVKKTMVFYRGRAPTGTKTKWKMNEYRAFEDDSAQNLRSEFSLCRVYTMSGCLRSFDRRPSDAAPPAGASCRRVLDAAASDDRNPPAAKRSKSLDSSPSGSHGDPSSANGGTMEWKILDAIEWDQVDWV